MPAIRPSTSTPEKVGGLPVITLDRKYAAVVADVLAVSLAGQQLDQQRGADQSEKEANDSCEQDLLHHRAATSPSAPVSSSACATLSSPTDRDAFTSTTSPGRNSLRNRSTAACASDTCTDSSPHEPPLYAPRWS